MRKEVVFAILGGLFLGLIIAFGIWITNKALTKKDTPSNKTQATSQNSQTPTGGNSEDLKIILAIPSEGDVVISSPFAVSGITKKNSWVVIGTSREDYVVKTNESGAFKEEIDAIGGINQLFFTVFDENRQKGDLLTNVVYSTEFAKEIEGGNSDTETATSAGSIREKVQEKLEIASKDPKFYLGTVTDKTNDTLQIKNPNGEIQFIAVVKDTISVVKVTKATTGIKYDDIAIGDFIAALGFKDGNDVLEAKRILVTNPPEPPEVSTVIGEVKSVKSREIIISQGASEIKLEFPPRWKGPEIRDLGIGDTIIVVGNPSGENLKPRTLFIAKEGPDE